MPVCLSLFKSRGIFGNIRLVKHYFSFSVSISLSLSLPLSLSRILSLNEITYRGTFGNIRLVNRFIGKAAPKTIHVPSGMTLDVFDAAQVRGMLWLVIWIRIDCIRIRIQIYKI